MSVLDFIWLALRVIGQAAADTYGTGLVLLFGAVALYSGFTAKARSRSDNERLGGLIFLGFALISAGVWAVLTQIIAFFTSIPASVYVYTVFLAIGLTGISVGVRGLRRWRAEVEKSCT